MKNVLYMSKRDREKSALDRKLFAIGMQPNPPKLRKRKEKRKNYEEGGG